MSVVVTVLGGIVGQKVIKALHNTSYSVVGTNSEVLGAELFVTKNLICELAYEINKFRRFYSFESLFSIF
jgi:hypothetical protein